MQPAKLSKAQADALRYCLTYARHADILRWRASDGYASSREWSVLKHMPTKTLCEALYEGIEEDTHGEG